MPLPTHNNNTPTQNPSTDKDKASLYFLSQPQKLSDALAAEEGYDCLSCRLTGATALTLLGAYTYISTTRHLDTPSVQRAITNSGSRWGIGVRKRGALGLGLSLVGMGVYRLVN